MTGSWRSGGSIDPTPDQFVAYTQAHVGEPIEITAERDGETVTVTVTPVLSEVEGEEIARIGVTLGAERVVRETRGPIGSIVGGATEVGSGVVRTVEGIGRIFGP